MKKNILLVITTILVLTGLFELYKNYTYYSWKEKYRETGDWSGNLTVASADKELMWEYRGNGEYRNIKTNRYGFRDYDYESTDKPDGTYRIAFIGDSVTLGYQVEYDRIFVRRFEAEAGRLSLPYKVQALNFSVDGYNTLQIYEMLMTKVLVFSPDKVVYVLCLNDFDFEDASSRKIRYFKKPVSFLADEIERAIKHACLRKKDYHFCHFEKNKHKVFQKIAAMRDELKKRSIDFDVVVVPVFEDSKENFNDYSFTQIHHEIRDFFVENKIEFIDLLDSFKEQAEAPRHYALDVWHLNTAGHQFVAQRLVTSLFRE